jgi:hypothetical protein
METDNTTQEARGYALRNLGYDYATIGSYALHWDCSLSEAINRLYEENVVNPFRDGPCGCEGEDAEP